MDRYNIPKSEIQNAARNMLIGLPLYGIVHKYKVSREEELLPIISTTERERDEQVRKLQNLLKTIGRQRMSKDIL